MRFPSPNSPFRLPLFLWSIYYKEKPDAPFLSLQYFFTSLVVLVSLLFSLSVFWQENWGLHHTFLLRALCSSELFGPCCEQPCSAKTRVGFCHFFFLQEFHCKTQAPVKNYRLKPFTGYSRNDCLPRSFVSKLGSLGCGRDTRSLWSFTINMTDLAGVSVLLGSQWRSVRAWGFSTLVWIEKKFFYIMKVWAQKSVFT